LFADLHLHSTYSDGTETPLELCRLAEEHDIKVISITDHDNVSGQKSLLNAQIPESIEIITGIEISTEINRKMLHILGYYIDIFDEKLGRFINDISIEKTESTRLNFENACIKNIFSYKWERVLELNPNQSRISGVHVVKAMEIDGYEVPGIGLWDMFHRYFWPANDNYISCATITGYDAVDIIKNIGGIPIIAHPKSIENDDIVLDLIKHGAQGIEVYHPIHTDDDILKYLQMAENEKLYISGGSDWHGKNDALGRTFAMTGLEHENYEILKLSNALSQSHFLQPLL